MKEDGINYLEGYTVLGKDVFTLIDLVKLELELILKVDMISLDNTECYNNNNDDNDDDDDDDENLVAHSLLQEVSGAAYSRLTAKICKRNKHSCQYIPFSL